MLFCFFGILSHMQHFKLQLVNKRSIFDKVDPGFRNYKLFIFISEIMLYFSSIFSPSVTERFGIFIFNPCIKGSFACHFLIYVVQKL
jgi:hypothetical protein